MYSISRDFNTSLKDHTLSGNIYRNILNSMEMYNPDTNTWEMIEVKLNGIADSSGACVMKRYYFQ